MRELTGWLFGLCILPLCMTHAQNIQKRCRELGIKPGIFAPGPQNTITDVKGISVGQITLDNTEDIYTGLTVILPHDGNLFMDKVPAAVFTANGFGKLMGSTQINELGNLETPIVLTNTLSVPMAAEGIIDYTLKNNPRVKSVNAVVGETNDGRLNNISKRIVTREHVLEAISVAKSGLVQEGNIGAGTGTVCFGYKGGIGSSSRILPASLGGFTIGVLVQSNFGGNLTIAGVPIGELLGTYSFKDHLEKSDGSCMIVVATDAPIDSRNLERLAKRAFLGLGRTGGIASNGSGDYVIAFSTHPANRIKHEVSEQTQNQVNLVNDAMSPLFSAVIEATEEAILNSLFMASSITRNGQTIKQIPVERILELLHHHRVLKP